MIGEGRIAKARVGSKVITAGGGAWSQSGTTVITIAQLQPAAQRVASLFWEPSAGVRHFPSSVEGAAQQQAHKVMPHCLPSQYHAPTGGTEQSTVPISRKNAMMKFDTRLGIKVYCTLAFPAEGYIAW